MLVAENGFLSIITRSVHKLKPKKCLDNSNDKLKIRFWDFQKRGMMQIFCLIIIKYEINDIVIFSVLRLYDLISLFIHYLYLKNMDLTDRI